MAKGLKVYDGRIIKAAAPQRFLLTVAYSASKMPLRGADTYIDLVDPEILERACWKFADNGFGVGLYHEDGNADCARVVENYIYRNPVPWVMKAADGTVVEVTAGDWLVGAILKPKTWEQFEKGLIGPTSIQGRVSRIPAREQTIARYRSAS